MRELHHIGIPTTEQKPNEIHLADAKLYITKVTESHKAGFAHNPVMVAC